MTLVLARSTDSSFWQPLAFKETVRGAFARAHGSGHRGGPGTASTEPFPVRSAGSRFGRTTGTDDTRAGRDRRILCHPAEPFPLSARHQGYLFKVSIRTVNSVTREA